MADDNIGGIVGYLGLDTEALDAGIKHAEKSLKDIETRMGTTSETALKLGVAFGAAYAAGAAVMVRSTIEAMDSQNDLAKSMGISVQSLVGLTFAGRQAGVTQEDLSTSVNKLNRNIQEAVSGNKQQVAAFNDLGVSTTDASGKIRNADAVLADIADKFQRLPDGAAKSSMAVELFGKSGAKLIPLLNDGSEGLKKQMELAQQLGLVFSNETAAAADHFNDTLDVLSQAGGGFATRLTAELLPALTNIGDVLLDVAKDQDTLATGAGFLSTILKSLVTVGLTVASTFADIGGWIGATAAAAVAAASGDFTGAMNIMKQRSADSDAAMATYEARVKKVWSETAASAEDSAVQQMASLKRLTEAEKKAAADAEEAAKKREKSNESIVKNLQLQAQTLGMTSAEIAIFKLRMDGATESQIQAAEAARKTIDAFSGLKEIGQIKIGATEGDDAAVLELQEKYKKLNEIVRANPELATEAAEAAALLAQQYQDGVDAKIAIGQAGNEAFLEQLRQRSEAIALSNEDEISQEMKRYQDDQELLEQALLNGVITEQKYREISERNESNHDTKLKNMKIKNWADLKKLNEQSWQAQLAIGLNTMIEMTAGLASHSRAAFEINKAAALSQATMKGVSGVMSAWEAGMSVGGPWAPVVAAGYAAAAGVYAIGQISAISSTQFGGGAASPSSGTPSAATSAPGEAGAGGGGAGSGGHQSLAVTGLDPNAMFDGKTVKMLASKLLDFQKDGGKVVFT
jgi:hypothetical protein